METRTSIQLLSAYLHCQNESQMIWRLGINNDFFSQLTVRFLIHGSRIEGKTLPGDIPPGVEPSTVEHLLKAEALNQASLNLQLSIRKLKSIAQLKEFEVFWRALPQTSEHRLLFRIIWQIADTWLAIESHPDHPNHLEFYCSDKAWTATLNKLRPERRRFFHPEISQDLFWQVSAQHLTEQEQTSFQYNLLTAWKEQDRISRTFRQVASYLKSTGV